MKAGWELHKFKDVCFFDKNKKGKEKIPYVGLEHIESNTGIFLGSKEPFEVKSSTFRFTKDHVLYGRLRPYLNKVLLPDFEGHCSSEIFPILVGNSLLREYLFYWFINDNTVKKISATSTGARMPRANMKEVSSFEIPIPPLKEQKQIVAILDQAFAAIDQAQANIQQNIQNAQDLFQSKLNQIFSQQGEGWEEKTFKEICSIITDGTHQTPKYFDSGYIFLSSKNVTSGKIDWENVKYLDEEQHTKMYSRLAPQINDILLAKNGTTGVAAIVDVDKVFDIYVSLAHL